MARLANPLSVYPPQFDSAAAGPAVFYNLGRLRTGDRIDVTLADRRTAVFRVYGAGLYLKTDFPSLACTATPAGPRCG
jgi:hypothetical protein